MILPNKRKFIIFIIFTFIEDANYLQMETSNEQGKHQTYLYL